MWRDILWIIHIKILVSLSIKEKKRERLKPIWIRSLSVIEIF